MPLLEVGNVICITGYWERGASKMDNVHRVGRIVYIAPNGRYMTLARVPIPGYDNSENLGVAPLMRNYRFANIREIV